ncbi:hypothetical protein [Streptococcus sciuri]|uniref:Uncharacterized protein n=1 Tax=Streptococcus sciuri TaxID=2973939 RepID=A0ABT2F8S2_9STRE|nr:hypothetical protein [Streptococcus sciuri]MCS4488883.1 hypothetical protein [Streptococcus sciuri]
MKNLDFEYLFLIVKPFIYQLQMGYDEKRREKIMWESRLLFYRLMQQHPELLEERETFYRHYMWALNVKESNQDNL